MLPPRAAAGFPAPSTACPPGGAAELGGAGRRPRAQAPAQARRLGLHTQPPHPCSMATPCKPSPLFSSGSGCACPPPLASQRSWSGHHGPLLIKPPSLTHCSGPHTAMHVFILSLTDDFLSACLLPSFQLTLDTDGDAEAGCQAPVNWDVGAPVRAQAASLPIPSSY